MSIWEIKPRKGGENEMGKKLKWFIAVAFLLLINPWLLLELGEAASPVKNEIVFGFSAPITGALSYAGEPSKKGYIAWAEMVNAGGGILVKEYGKKLPVRMVYYDDKTDPTTAAKIYEKLITQDKVDFILSPWGSSIGFAVSQIAQKYKMPVIFVWISSDPIYKQGYDYVFGLIQPASQHTWSAVDVLKDKKVVKDPPKKLYFVTAKELYPMTADKGAVDYAKKFGFEVYYEEVEKGCKDFTPVITKMKSLGAEGMVTSTYYADFFVLYRQIQELGYKPKYLYAAHSDLIDFADAFGAKAVEGVCAHGFWGMSWKTVGNQDFIAWHKKKWGEDPNQWTITVAGAQVMKQAIEKAGTLNSEEVKKTLQTAEFDCMLSKVKYVNEGGITNLNKLAFTGLLQWQNGKLLFVYPEEVAEAKFKYPIPWSK
jgi:branched-chain amino acid transport system substrate-binding protein